MERQGEGSSTEGWKDSVKGAVLRDDSVKGAVLRDEKTG